MRRPSSLHALRQFTCASLAYFGIVAFGTLTSLSFVPLVSADSCPVQNTPPTNEVHLSADEIRGKFPDAVSLRGRSQIEYSKRRMRADKIIYTKKSGRIRAVGNVRYTSCPTKDPIWYLSADEIVGDLDDSKVAAKNMWLFINDVPIVNVPRYLLSFDDKRKTGFLTPSVDYTSKAGYGATAPFYFNLAPNYDAEIAPTYLSKRGFMTKGQLRSLSRYSKNTANGALIDDTQENDTRHFFNITHETLVSDTMRLAGELKRVSDEDYLDDIGAPGLAARNSFLRSHVDFDFASNDWHFNLAADSFQRSDTGRNSIPFKREPHASLSKSGRISSAGPSGNIHYNVETFYTSFGRKRAPAGELTKAKRWGGSFELIYPWQTDSYFLQPSFKMHYTRYDLPNTTDIKRTVPVYSMRAGLRRSKLVFNKRWIHTLEPEVAYVYAPERNHADIPLLDTRLHDFNLDKVLDGNRYTGLDRIDNANQLGVIVNSRLLKPDTGEQVARFGLGQVFYFDRPETCLYYRDGQCEFGRGNHPRSDYVAEFDFDYSRHAWIKTSLLWDSEEDRISQSLFKLHLSDGGNQVANLFYRKRRRESRLSLPNPIYGDSLEQAGVNLGKNWGNNWSAFANWNYDIRRSKYLEFLAGAQYKSCCWGVRLAARRYLSDIDAVDGSLSLDEGEFDYDSFIGLEFTIQDFTLNSGAGISNIVKSDFEGFALP